MSRYIDADALSETFGIGRDCKHCEIGREKCEEDWLSIIEICGIIAEEPTVDAVPVKHGKWEIIGLSDAHTELYNCGACLKVWSVPRGKNPASLGYKFCPNCGAKMDEVKE